MDKSTETTQSSSQDSEEATFDEIFDSFCKVGDRLSDEIALRNIDKWFKQANLFTKSLTSTDTAITFSKIAGMKKKITKDEFQEMLNDLAKQKGMEATELQAKLVSAGKPSFAGATKYIRGSVAAENMERLTDPSSYTGSHKERFDSEGKGLGLAGRYEIADKDGYVQGYKHKGTYESPEGSEDDKDKDAKDKDDKEKGAKDKDDKDKQK